MLDNLSCPYEGDGNKIHPFCNSKVNVNPILQQKKKKKTKTNQKPLQSNPHTESKTLNRAEEKIPAEKFPKN
jgi:hypothetical protein